MRTLLALSISPAEAPPLSSPLPSSAAQGCLSANAITILIILLCALICSLTLHASIRLFLRSSLVSGRLLPPQINVATDQPLSHERRVKPCESELAVYLSGGVLEARAGGAECCAICLVEFEDGEKAHLVLARPNEPNEGEGEDEGFTLRRTYAAARRVAAPVKRLRFEESVEDPAIAVELEDFYVVGGDVAEQQHPEPIEM
ncbi:hypothetical protein MLD38_016611 [Melastoma candidum]|uniref:Uncharacterized protein n=1 Tax=Melastoma candidum TaxID=119954 RepID=A0ACB9QMU5_9MYRT|nr:hypothetical protein MLD38_016611 [Melastoma candidum]